ncbi:leishmanolysin family protein, putative [Ichthyophthirius multifiliis]|uniref:Leishmanolysin family protein, putative n=1 Tax=Ichthyophthirius multifiliis TaxID=5932 RepID=G0QX87_ICHMU|nr:leishmanolysin family protein, putative [Ichthyophthirius multifiliis]EGR30167.1 leishmanolysin family protein, putative [Ichthyophthirius multifiliis]|eukprot:XP_004031403.1 leishmanolysin family protein, putative [Ichthyophthirius multifiliis]
MQKQQQLESFLPDTQSQDVRNLLKKPPHKCGLVTIFRDDKDKGKNSDLHLYVSYKMDKDIDYLAYAIQCQHFAGIGVTHGSINFNLEKMPLFKQNALIEFEDFLEVIIHEMTHVLGFSENDIERWVLPKGTTHAFVKTKIKGVDTVLLKTPNVLRFARDYFNCPILEGMPLQHLGSKDSQISHWPNTIIQNEYMSTSTSFIQAYFSGFTTNLLRDTGYYAEINASMEEQMFYGKGKGCEYVMRKCDIAFREYCNPKTDVGLCDFYHHGFSSCKPGLYNDPDCNNLYPYQNGKCWDVNSEFNTDVYKRSNGTKFGTDSRCFNGNLLGFFGADCSSDKPV